MSQSVRTRALPGSVPAARKPSPVREEPEDGLVIAADELLERLWRLATSMRTALILMIGLAILAFIGTMLVQAPSGMSSDPAAYQAWLATVRPKYGGWTNVIDGLGFFSVFSSWWFKGIVLAIVASIMACSVNRFRGLWKTAIRPRMKMTPTFYMRAPHHADIDTDISAEAALERVRGAFGARHYRTVVQRDGDEIHVYADRFRWAPFGTLMAHLSLILILIGALVGSSFGFRNSSFAVPVGSTVDIGYGTGLSVEAKSFSDSYYTNGAPSDYASQLVLYDASGTPLKEQTIRVNQPLQYGDVTLYQSFFGPAATVNVAGADGTVLYNSGVPLLWTSEDGTRRIGRLTVDDPAYTVFVVMPSSGDVDTSIKAGQAQFEVYRNQTDTAPIAVQIATQGEPVQIAGLTFTFEREQQFTGLIVAKDPGQMLVWAGAILLILGLFLVFFFPNRRIWARIHPEGERVQLQLGATVRHDATFGPDFQHLASDMSTALAGPGAA